MSSAAQTKVFGMKIGIDPKILAVALGVIVGLVFWYNMRSSDDDTPASSVARPEAGAGFSPVGATHRKPRPDRHPIAPADRNTLRIKPVDATDGRIDPTLRTDLIARLRSIQPLAPSRSLFELASKAPLGPAAPIDKVVVPVNAPQHPAAPVNVPPATAAVNIPLKYYGFVHPASRKDSNRGLFLDGDNILVAKEGDQLDGKYLVVELNANSAKMEDIQLRQGQTLPVAPEANAQ
jgi:hypothetical protein